MPDEGSVRYGVSNFCVLRGADGKYVPVGSVFEFDITTSDDCDIPVYENIRALMEPAEPVTICFKLPWWSDPRIRFIRLIGWDSCVFLKYKCPYTVRSLRRGGKSHRGKHA